MVDLAYVILQISHHRDASELASEKVLVPPRHVVTTVFFPATPRSPKRARKSSKACRWCSKSLLAAERLLSQSLLRCHHAHCLLPACGNERKNFGNFDVVLSRHGWKEGLDRPDPAGMTCTKGKVR